MHHIISPRSFDKEISYTNWAFHLILGFAEMIPLVSLVVAFADHYLFNHDKTSIPLFFTKSKPFIPSFPPLPANLQAVIDKTPAFNKYAFAADARTILTDLTIRPANLFFEALGSIGKSTMPGSKELFRFLTPPEQIRRKIYTKPDTETVSFTAKRRDIETFLGQETYSLSYGEVKEMLESQKIYISPLLSKAFYVELKKVMAADQMVILPGHDSAPMLLSALIDQNDHPNVRDFLKAVQQSPENFGFVSNGTMLSFDELCSLSIYQIGAMIVKTEDYHCFVDDGYRLAKREVGEKDQIHLINACGIRGFHKSPDHEIDKRIMKETLKTAMRSIGPGGYFVSPAIGMGVWRGTPEVYWTAFFEAVVELDISLEKILVSPGHQTTSYGKHKGANGNEFETFLRKYQKEHPDNQNLANVVNLFSKKTDVLLLAKHLKKAFPDKVVGLLNASDPDVTLGYHVGEYVNNLHHASTTEENYGAAGSSCLNFETITGVHSDPMRVLQSAPFDFVKEAIQVIKAQGFSTNYCYKEGDYRKVLVALATLQAQGFFKNKNQEFAKSVFKEVMKELDLAVNYMNADGWDFEAPITDLDHSIFYWCKTFGVENDIPKASKDHRRVHLFSAASQYNAAEASSAFTPPVGQAMIKSTYDYTQGPLAQRTNPTVFELVTAFLTHLGFNMMEKALPSSGTTYTSDSSIEHGYLRATNENVAQLANELEAGFRNFEAPCYESRVSESAESVYLMLGAAPAIGYSYGLDAGSPSCKKLQYYAYTANLTAQFKQALLLLRENPKKEVVLHITGTGLGVFGCDNDEFAKAFKKTASIFQSLLSREEKKRMHVQLESYHGSNGPDQLKSVSKDLLKLGKDKPRIE